jgi:hypothetical protein
MRFVVSDKISSSSSSSSFTFASSFLDTKIFLLLFLPNFDKDCFFDDDDEKEEEEEIVGAPLLTALFKAERKRNVVISSSLLNFARNKEREDEMILF